MSTTYNPNDAARLKHVAALAQLTKSKLDALDGITFSSANISNGKINFYASTDCTGTALQSVDLPEELYLDQVRTTIVQSFAWSDLTYPGSTNPNLDGKPVLVLAVKGDKSTNPTLTFSFLNLESLIDTYTAADKSIDISGHSIAVNISSITGNLLELDTNGLFVGSDDTKIDKVTNATAGNFVIFGASGAVVDSGVTFASDADVIAMLNDKFGAGSISSIE